MSDTFVENIQLPDGSLLKIKGVPSGGTTNQILAKASDADADTVWTDQQDLSGFATKAELDQISSKIPDGLVTITDLTSALEPKADKAEIAAELTTVNSEISNLDSKATSLETEVASIKDTTYTKQEVDDIVTSGTVDLSGYYNKTEVNGLLINKANISDIPSLENYYNKTEVDTLLSSKADAAAIPDVSGFATKTELTEGLATKQPTGDYALASTVSGMESRVQKNKEDIETLDLMTKAIDASIPKTVSQLTNDSKYVTETQLDEKFASIEAILDNILGA